MKRNSERSRPTPSPPRPRDLLRILESADVGKNFDAFAVGGHGGFERMREVFLAPLFATRLRAGGCAPLPPAPAFRRSVPLLPSRMTSGAVGNFQRGRLDAGQRGNAERARQNRDVRRRAAARSAKADHARAIERGGVGGREILGDEDRVRRVLRRPACHVPVRIVSTRRPTSRTSFARCASSSLRSAASRSA